MVRRTYGDVRPELTRFASSCGLQIDDPRMIQIVNNAIEELMNEGDWVGIIDRLRFKITGGRPIAIPSDYDRMLYCTLDHQPMQMHSPWYEFVGVGPGWWNYWNYGTPDGTPGADYVWNREFIGVLDRDDAATFRDVPTDQTYYLRVGAQLDERVDGERPKILLQGYDADKNWIRTQDDDGNWRDGIEVAINGDTAPFWIQTTQSIRQVTAAIKPTTKGEVFVSVANADQTTVEPLVTYAPRDRRPFYRRYLIPGLSSEREYTVITRLRRRFVPIEEDNDWLCITSIPALKSMIQAIYYNEAKDPVAYDKYKANAIALLKKEVRAYVGLQRQKPLISFGESQGVMQNGVYVL